MTPADNRLGHPADIGLFGKKDEARGRNPAHPKAQRAAQRNVEWRKEQKAQ